MASKVMAASAAVPVQALSLRCVTVRQDTGFRRPVSRSGLGCGRCIPYSRRLAGMAGTDPADEIAALKSKLASIEAVLDPGAIESEAAGLREQAADPSLWSDP